MPGHTRQWTRPAGSSTPRVLNSQVLTELRTALLKSAAPRPDDEAVDLTAGQGFVTCPLAELTARVLAIELTPRSVRFLLEEASRRGLENVEGMASDLRAVELPPESVDVVVAADALRQLSNEQKRAMVARVRRWLRPNGRLAIADVTLGQWDSAWERSISDSGAGGADGEKSKGLLRVADALRSRAWGLGEQVPSPHFWVEAMRGAGFEGVVFDPVNREAGVVSGRVPAPRGLAPTAGQAGHTWEANANR